MQLKKILHVVSTADFIDHFLIENIAHYDINEYFFAVACSPDRLLNELSEIGHFLPVPILIYRSYTPFADIIAIRRLRKVIKNHGFEIVIGHTPKGALLSMVAAKFAGVTNRVYYRHGLLYQTAYGFKRKLLKVLERLTVRCATVIVNVSKSVDSFATIEGINPPEKRVFLGTDGSCGAFNPIKFSIDNVQEGDIKRFKHEFTLGDASIILGFFGRMVNDKGINDLIAAWEIVIKKHPKAKLVLAGEFEERDALPEITKEKIKFSESIVYLEYYKQLDAIYASLDIFILPSYREGLPTVILEASSMELPVITTKVTGCIDAIVENETGIFCTHDPENIAEKISFYIDHPELRRKHGQNGRKFVLEHFNQSRIWDDFENKVLKL